MIYIEQMSNDDSTYSNSLVIDNIYHILNNLGRQIQSDVLNRFDCCASNSLRISGLRDLSHLQYG